MLKQFMRTFSKIWYAYRFFKKRGIPSPEYEFLFGNFRKLRKEVII